MRHRSPSADTDADSDWTYSETIDEAKSAIRVRGRVDRLGADLLRGTIEQLSRRGHRDITVTMEHPDDVDACARGVLVEVAARLAARHGGLTIRWIAGAVGDPTVPSDQPRPHCVDEQGRGAVRRRANAVSRRPAEEHPRCATAGHDGI
jgi:anti-anti-sigma regulatory factor